MRTATRGKAFLTPTEALIPRSMFDALPEYSCSIPTGKTIGKCWKRREPYEVVEGVVNVWKLGCYERRLEPDRRGRRQILVRFRTITIVEDE